MNEAIFSGVLAKIYEQVCEFIGETYDVKTEVENNYHRYDESYRERHGEVKIFCAKMRKPIPLDGVYVGVQFLNEHTASRYRSSEEVEQAFRERNRRHFDSTSDERRDGTQVANDEQYLMLLGGPGVGKSTFLRKVGLEALKGKDGDFKHECIPVFLELKNFREDQIDIEALIIKEFETCGCPHPEHLTKAVLESGKLVICFDGLDEVPRANVDNVIRKIGDFVDRYSQNRFIASCRIAAYKGGFKRFTEVEMADFDDTQIHTYIKNWFDSTPYQHRKQLDEEMGTAEQCWETLNAPEHQATKELARNPLLLTLLCMVYDNSQNFQRNRANLYEDAFNIFLKEWAAEKRVNRGASINQYLDIADEKRMLSEIAAKNFEIDRLFFRENELIAQIQEFGEGNANTPQTFNAPQILDTILIDQGLFVERVRDSYSFSHLTFQEYLTANYIVKDTRSIKGLAKKHLHDDQWREVFLLTAGLMHEADDLLMAMEAEASKLINTDLKSLFGWAKRITDTTNDAYSQLTKQAFVIHQYFLLNLLNKFHEAVKSKTGQSQDQALYDYFDLDLHLYLDLYLHLYFDPDPEPDLYPDLYFNLERDLDPDLDPDLYSYLHQIHWISPVSLSYYDFYRYMDKDFYSSTFSKFGDRFDSELSTRMKTVKRIKEAKIFKRVNLQQILQRLNTQREFIKAAMRGESVEPPAESIHDTWLAVLGITDDMLAISDEELKNCHPYLRAVDLILACKETAGRVSPEVWQEIEVKLLASGT